MRILISAGEPSGDVVAARVANEIRRRRSDCLMYGLGGPHMARAGIDVVARTTHLGAVGITEGAAVAPALVGCWTRLRARVRRDSPAAALLIGNDVFHMIVARRLRRLGIPAISYFPPQVWLWRSMARFIARSYDVILASFPEEEHLYHAAGGTVLFVGHYLVDDLSPVTPEERATARTMLALPVDGVVIGLLPGSRKHEIRRIAPVFLDAARHLAERDATLRFTLPVADDRFRATLEREIRARRLDRLVAVHDRSLTPMQAADLVLVSSGTATLEAMLLQLPMIVAYRMSTSSYWIVRGLLRAGVIRDRFMSMPNLVLGRPVVPEFLQSRMTAAALAAEARRILSSSDAQSAQRSAYREGVARLAGGHSVERVAEAVLAAAERRHT